LPGSDTPILSITKNFALSPDYEITGDLSLQLTGKIFSLETLFFNNDSEVMAKVTKNLWSWSDNYKVDIMRDINISFILGCVLVMGYETRKLIQKRIV
jgi:uncharacterized protein YxjI